MATVVAISFGVFPTVKAIGKCGEILTPHWRVPTGSIRLSIASRRRDQSVGRTATRRKFGVRERDLSLPSG
jgi:hypothetical protein